LISTASGLLAEMEKAGEFDPSRDAHQRYSAELEDLASTLRHVLMEDRKIWERADPHCQEALRELRI
jgi:hypothetical protein